MVTYTVIDLLILSSKGRSWKILGIYLKVRDFTNSFSAKYFKDNNELILNWFLKVFVQSDTILQFRFSKSKGAEAFFNVEIKVSKALNTYSAAIEHKYKTLFVLLGKISGLYFCPITNAIGTSVGIVSAILVFSISNRICENVLKNNEKGKISIEIFPYLPVVNC